HLVLLGIAINCERGIGAGRAAQREHLALAVAAARNLDAPSKVLALSGPTSSDTALAIYGYAEQNKVPFVVPVAAFPQLTKPGTRYTFRIEPDAAGWGYAIAQLV